MIDWQNLIHRQLTQEQNSDSHTEPDTFTFHPSSLSRCERQCTIQKLGLETHGVNTLWNFYLGTRQHDDLQDWFGEMFPGVSFEQELETHHETDDGGAIKITGHADVVDQHDGIVYDFKTRKSWNGFSDASDAHKDQLTCYMKMAGVTQGQLVYLAKSAPWDDYEPIVLTYPADDRFDHEGDVFEYDPDRWSDIVSRAVRIRDGLKEFEKEHGRLPEDRSEVPFETCGCWLCNSEDNDDE